MTKINATDLGNAILAATFETTIAKTKTFQIAMADMPIESILVLLAHGVQRKFNDAVGGSDKTAEVKVDLAAAMIADYKAGKVRKERAAGVPQATTIARRLVRANVKTQVSTEKWTAFMALDADAQSAKLDAIIDKMDEKTKTTLDAQVAAEIKLIEERANASKKAADGLDLSDF